MKTVTAQPAIAVSTPDGAVAALVARLGPVGEEVVAMGESIGRVTAQPIVADRPSPPSDVSAMDGYAVRLADITRGPLEVSASVLPGRPAPRFVAGKAVRVMTGAVVPEGAEAVVRREDVEEHGELIVLRAGVVLKPGQSIRKVGENLVAGAVVLPAGALIDPAVMTALSSFGVSTVRVQRKVRIAVVVTGDELLPVEAPAEPWQVRDSNGPALQAMFAACPWVSFTGRDRVADEPGPLLAAIRDGLRNSDALFVTGGVSAGTHDFVPSVLRQAGCEVLFHKLPLRPGHPVLGAVGPQGQLVMGLPGNPLSVMATGRRIGAVALRSRAGFSTTGDHRPVVTLTKDDGRTLHLWWYRPVKLVGGGEAELLETRGSGDVVSATRSDGFIEVPPNRAGRGPWPFYRWGVD